LREASAFTLVTVFFKWSLYFRSPCALNLSGKKSGVGRSFQNNDESLQHNDGRWNPYASNSILATSFMSMHPEPEYSSEFNSDPGIIREFIHHWSPAVPQTGPSPSGEKPQSAQSEGCARKPGARSESNFWSVRDAKAGQAKRQLAPPCYTPATVTTRLCNTHARVLVPTAPCQVTAICASDRASAETASDAA
jgi:hypothetical protein